MKLELRDVRFQYPTGVLALDGVEPEHRVRRGGGAGRRERRRQDDAGQAAQRPAATDRGHRAGGRGRHAPPDRRRSSRGTSASSSRTRMTSCSPGPSATRWPSGRATCACPSGEVRARVEPRAGGRRAAPGARPASVRPVGAGAQARGAGGGAGDAHAGADPRRADDRAGLRRRRAARRAGRPAARRGAHADRHHARPRLLPRRTSTAWWSWPAAGSWPTVRRPKCCKDVELLRQAQVEPPELVQLALGLGWETMPRTPDEFAVLLADHRKERMGRHDPDPG